MKSELTLRALRPAVLLLVLFCCACFLAGCGAMKLSPADMDSDQEGELFDIVEPKDGFSSVYDFQVDGSKVRGIEVKSEQLSPDGKWEAESYAAFKLKDERSRLYVTYDPGEGGIAGYGEKNTEAAASLPPLQDPDGLDLALNRTEETEIEKGRPVILAVFTDSGKAPKDLESYDKPEKYKGYRNLCILTVTFRGNAK
ncbi:MAG: hypothetical protein ACOX4I_00865 [Anaerovoracaceae bacterium]|jgi:hypothetical protein